VIIRKVSYVGREAAAMPEARRFGTCLPFVDERVGADATVAGAALRESRMAAGARRREAQTASDTSRRIPAPRATPLRSGSQVPGAHLMSKPVIVCDIVSHFAP
jgi:hypothetical protein